MVWPPRGWVSPSTGFVAMPVLHSMYNNAMFDGVLAALEDTIGGVAWRVDNQDKHGFIIMEGGITAAPGLGDLSVGASNGNVKTGHRVYETMHRRPRIFFRGIGRNKQTHRMLLLAMEDLFDTLGY